MESSKQDKLYPMILDCITEGVFTVDEQFCVTYLNTAAELITGIRGDQAIGRKCYEVFRGSHCEERCAMRVSLETGLPQRDVKATILNADMEVVPLCLSTSALRDTEGNLLGGVEIFRDTSDIEALRTELSDRRVFGDVVGASQAMQAIFRLIPDVAETDVPVLIEGPSGTGKELVAQAIHNLSPRRDQPFVGVNCSALPDTLLESELFGYVRGAFTDARQDKPGHFRRAHKGTLFLDEIGDVSAAFQSKLLRVLQEGEFQPLGSTRTERVDVRIVAATNRNLKQLVREGRYREDLFYRLRVIPIMIPPLRERRDDIIPLIEHYSTRLAAKTGKPIHEVSPSALTALYDYDYPGNVRELINILERAFVLCHGERIELDHLPSEVVSPIGRVVEAPERELRALEGKSHTGGHGVRPPRRRPGRLKPSEHKLIHAMSGGASTKAEQHEESPGAAFQRPEVRSLVEALDEHGWQRRATARALGISRSTLWRLMKEYGLI